jgi:hypothetical protein
MSCVELTQLYAPVRTRCSEEVDAQNHGMGWF